MAIKDFIRLLENKRNDAKHTYEDSEIVLAEIIASSEYKALKALSEQKIVVTDDMTVKAARAYNKHFDESGYPIESMEVALQAVFDMVNSEGGITASEEKPLDDEWIEWRNGVCPDLPIETKIQIKGYKGTISERLVGDAKHDINWNNVIAYRIISEPKKECECKNLKPGQVFQTTKDWKCRFCGELVNANKPTPKQTLFETLEMYGDIDKMKLRQFASVLSQYLERLK